MDLLLCAIPKSTPMYVHVEDSAHIINKCGTGPYSELVVFVYVRVCIQGENVILVIVE